MEQKPLHVLLVDDDPNMLATMQDILMAKGFTPILANNGRAALARSQSGDIDVALIDLHLEDIPGLELLGQLRLNSPSTEGILLTGHASQDSAIQAINAGAFAYFQKPCDIDQLVLSIRRAGEKRSAGQALRASEASLQAVLQSTADGILAVNRENKVLYANQRFAELWQIPPAVLASREDAVLLQYVLDQLVDPQVFLQQVQELYRSEEDSFDTLDFKDGRVFERLSRPLMEGTEPCGRVWSFRDVTARKQAEDALRKSDAQYRLLASNISDVIWILDLQTSRFTYVSPSVEGLRGYTAAEVLAQAMPAALTPASAAQIQNQMPERLEQAKKGHSGPYLDEVEQPRKDGTNVWTETTTDYHFNPQTQHWEVYGVSRNITERKKAQDALQLSEMSYRDLFENSLAGISQARLDGRLLRVNRAYAQMYGYDSPEQMLAEVSDIGHQLYALPGQRESVLETIAAKGQLDPTEFNVIRRNGTQITVLVGAQPITDSQGNLVCYQATQIDITERKKAEDALHASEERFRSLYENATIGIYRTTPDGRILMANPSLVKMLGFDSFEQLAQRNLAEKDYEPDYPRAQFLAAIEKDGHVTGLENAWRRQDGSTIFIRESARLIRDAQGQTLYYDGTVEDITERKRVEDNLAEEKSLLRTLIDNLPDVVYAMDLQGRKILSNKADWQASGGKSMEDVIGKTDLEMYPPELARDFWAADKAVMDSGTPILNLEEPGRDADGNPVRVLSSKIPLRDGQGKVIGLVGIGHNITERKQAEKLQQAVYRIAQAADQAESLDSLYPSIHAIIKEVMPADNFNIALLDKGSGLIGYPYFVSELGHPALPGAERGLTGYVIRTAKPLLCDQVLFDSLKQRGEIEQVGAIVPIWLGVPLLVDGRAIGMMAVQDFKNAQAYGEREQHILEFVSSQVAMAIHRKQSEEALIRAEQKYRSIFENATEGIHQTTIDGKIISVNLAGARMLGFDSTEELMADAGYLNSSFYVQPGRRAEFQKLMEAHDALAGFESEVYRKDGSTAWISENVHSVCDEQGNLLYYEGTSVDITERKQAEEKIMESEEMFRSFIEQSSEGAVLLDEQGSIIEWNHAQAQITGIPSQQAIGQAYWDIQYQLLPPERRAERSAEFFRQAMLAAFRTGKFPTSNGSTEVSIYTPAGETKSILQASFPIPTKTGYRVGSLVRDITGRKRAEAELQASRAAEQNFAERLTILSEVTTELSKADSLDALCRRTIELGRERLDIDRLSIWFLAEDHTTMQGTFGVDTEGRITDEHKESFTIGPDFPSWSVMHNQTPLLHRKEAELALQGNAVGQGEHVTAGLWDGKTVIGYISVDNLLRQRPFSERDCEIIRLYASAVGHLVSLKRTETELQVSQAAEIDFAGRLTILSEVTTELSKVDSLDALCRRTVELGRERLDFDRLSIFFLSEDSAFIQGSFGVDTAGRITDERGDRYPVGPESNIWPILQTKIPLIRLPDSQLLLKGQTVGQGMHILAGLWDGDTAIGYITVDNLLRQRPFSDRDCEIIRLYASALGQLVSLKRVEREMRSSQERYRMLAENMSDTIWLMNLDLKTTYISPSVTRQSGFTLAELNTVPLDRQMAPESFALFVKLFTSRLAPKYLAETDAPVSASLELELYRKDGSAYWSANTYTLIRDPQGKPLAILGSGRDITESKQTWDALQNSEKRFRALIENNTDAIVLVDPRGRILYESPAYGRMTGRDIRGRLGQSSFEFLHPEDQPAIVRILNELIQSPGGIAQIAFRFQHSDGSWRWAEATATNLLGDSAVQAVVINLHEITERKQAEETLANTERIYRQAITRTGGVPYQRDYNREKYTFLGEGIQSLTGYPPAEMTGDLFNSRLRQIESYGEFKELEHAERIRLARQGDAIKEWREDYLFERKDGGLVWLADHSVQLKDAAGTPTGSLGILLDITQRKQAEQSMRQRVTELEVLYETGLHISSLLEPKEIGRKVIEVLSEKMSWRHASIRLYNPETGRLELLVFNRPGLTTQQLQAETRRLNRAISKPGQGFSGWVVEHGQPIRSGDVSSDSRYIRTFKDVRSGLYVPMQVGGRTMGVIGAESEQADAFTEGDERLLTTLAAQAGVAIENARLLAETLRRVEELGALADCSTALRIALTRSEIVAVILDQLMAGLFPADNVCLAAYDPLTGENIIEAARGMWTKYIGQHSQSGIGLVGLVAETRRPYQTNDASHVAVDPQRIELKKMEAAAGVPLLVQDQFIGSLWIGRTGSKKAPNPAPFSANQMQLLGSIADMAANALQRASLHEQALKHADELLAVNNMGRILSETLDLGQIYEKLDESVWQLLKDISVVAIALYDSDKKQFTCVRFNTDSVLGDAASLPPAPLEPPGQGTQSEAIHTRQPVIINNLRERLGQLSFKLDIGTQDGRLTQSGLYVPMLAQGRVIGVIQVQSYTLNRFSQSDAGLLSLLANTAAADIQNARLFAETQKRLHNLAALHEIDVAISASVDIHVTLDILLEQVVSELNTDAAAILLLNPLSRSLEYAASQGFRNHQVKGLHIPLGSGLAGQAALQRQIQRASSLPDEQPLQESPRSALNIYEGEGFVSHHAIPLSAKGQVQGVLEVFLRSPFQPDDEWFTFLETLARQAAIAIDNNNLFDNLQRSNTNIVLAYDATIQGWSQALELCDKETEGHARRVTERTVQLAQLVGVPATDLEHVRRGTLLHDIGKMGIPDAILLKPGKLTEAEWSIMRRHPVFAYEMLSSITYLRPALDIPHYHHEKWDGSGYPDGLKGEQIPLYARIFAIVDVYDALTNDRPYRPAWSSAQAIEYIRAESGRHFDPAIVETFLNMLARE